MIYMFNDMLTRYLTDILNEVLTLANENPSDARRNPESYVYFIAHMFHLRGEEDGGEPWSIQHHWDFKINEEKLFWQPSPRRGAWKEVYSRTLE
jgi:hypothetical protein